MLNVRLLAAADMYGRRGSRRRSVAIAIEFFAGFIGCVALGVLALLDGGGGWQTLVGAWLLGVGLNYLPLTIHACSLLAAGSLEDELAGLDLDAQLRRAGRNQFLIAVPLAVAVASLVRRGP